MCGVLHGALRHLRFPWGEVVIAASLVAASAAAAVVVAVAVIFAVEVASVVVVTIVVVYGLLPPSPLPRRFAAHLRVMRLVDDRHTKRCYKPLPWG